MLSDLREISVRITPASASGNRFDEGVDLIAVSTDGGSTWQERQLPGKRDWAPNNAGAIPRWVEPLAWDSTGSLYLLWTDMKGVWLARSNGLHWKTWMIAETEAMLYFPYLTARRCGELAATWFSGAAGNLHWQACRIQINDHGEPEVTRSSLLVTESFNDPHVHSAPFETLPGNTWRLYSSTTMVLQL